MKKGLVAEFTSPHDLVAAIEAMRSGGYRALDAFTPYGIREVERALGLGRSRIPYSAFFMGALGFIGAYAVMWWTSAWDYPLNVGSFPAHSPPAYIPICFETTVLLASLTAFLGFFVAAELPRMWDPLFEVDGFERASIDRFFLAVDADDQRFEPSETDRALRSFAPLRVVPFGRGRG
jgi:hypothetical protein